MQARLSSIMGQNSPSGISGEPLLQLTTRVICSPGHGEIIHWGLSGVDGKWTIVIDPTMT